MPRIAMIGAGSIVFTRTLLMDLLAVPAFRNGEFRFMSRTMSKLERLDRYVRRVIRDNRLDATTLITTDRIVCSGGQWE